MSPAESWPLAVVLVGSVTMIVAMTVRWLFRNDARRDARRRNPRRYR